MSRFFILISMGYNIRKLKQNSFSSKNYYGNPNAVTLGGGGARPSTIFTG